MIDTTSPTDRIRAAYDLLSPIYAAILGPLERRFWTLGLDRAGLRAGDRVLEVGVGPGLAFLEICRRIRPWGHACGVDLSRKMLRAARRRLHVMNGDSVPLIQADARWLPFASETFDLVFTSYVLDLLPTRDLAVVVDEWRRVLLPGGRVVAVSLSKVDDGASSAWDFTYRHLPATLRPYLLGGCRPVRARDVLEHRGFIDVDRRFIRHPLLPSEIVYGRKPAR